MFAEEGESYVADGNDSATEREIISLIKAFSDVRSPQSRKKIVELVKTMVH